MIKTPTVTVLMPAYNSASFIAEAIESVLSQTYKDYELLIINDGSSDKTQEIINSYKTKDNRIRSIKQKNIGLVATLNKGIKLAKGAYIARIDSDDIWNSDKLIKQMSVISKDNSIVLIGSSYDIVDESGSYISRVIQPTEDDDIRRAFYLRNPFGHSSVVYLKSAVEKAGLYDENMLPAEDFDLWIKIAKLGRIENIDKICLKYRLLKSGISQSNSYKQTNVTNKLCRLYWFANPVTLASISEIRKSFIRANNTNKHIAFQVLKDYAQIGVKMIKYGQIFNGILQLARVCLSSVFGVPAVTSRLIRIRPGSFVN